MDGHTLNRKENTHDNAVPYEHLNDIYVILEVERPLRYVAKIGDRTSWEGVSVQDQTVHGPYDMADNVLHMRKSKSLTVTRKRNTHRRATDQQRARHRQHLTIRLFIGLVRQ